MGEGGGKGRRRRRRGEEGRRGKKEGEIKKKFSEDTGPGLTVGGEEQLWKSLTDWPKGKETKVGKVGDVSLVSFRIYTFNVIWEEINFRESLKDNTNLILDCGTVLIYFQFTQLSNS